MLRSAVSKVMWVGRATVFLVGLAVVLALVLGVANTALGVDGRPFLLGRSNVASSVSTLLKEGPGPALSLEVDSGPPLAVSSDTKVDNLNADKLDGKSDTDFWSGKSYVDYSDQIPGTANDFKYAQMDCDQGDTSLGGGYYFDGSAGGYEVMIDRIQDSRSYAFGWRSDDTPDNVYISVTCADFPPLRS